MMKAPKSRVKVAAMVCLVFALLVTFNGYKSIKSGKRLPEHPAERQGYLTAMIGVPTVLYLASGILFWIGRAREKRHSDERMGSSSKE